MATPSHIERKDFPVIRGTQSRVIRRFQCETKADADALMRRLMKDGTVFDYEVTWKSE
jgi:hypothetical protein